MNLGDDGEAVVLQALDDPKFPQRLGTVELLGNDSPGQALELLITAGAGQAGVPDVEVEVEVIVIDPDRSPVARYEGQPLAIPGYVLKLSEDVGFDPSDIDASIRHLELRGLEEDHRTDVHVSVGRLQRQKRSIEMRERLEVG
jgi:hypothetical protein